MPSQMASKRKFRDYEHQPIEVIFLKNGPRDWIPGRISHRTAQQDASPSTHGDGSRSSRTESSLTEQELKEHFANFVCKEISEITTEKKGTAIQRASQLKPLFAALAMAQDLTSKLDAPPNAVSLDDCIDQMDASIIPVIMLLLNIWKNDSKDDDTFGETTSRGKDDMKAQKIVPPVYDNCCVVTGMQLVDAAHIVDIHVVKSMTNPTRFWNMLRMFWPLERIEGLEITGSEVRNILPLAPHAHRLWDRHKFALRPIAHPTDPEHLLYLQFIWFDDYHKEIGFMNQSEVPRKRLKLADLRRETAGGTSARYVQHGDILQLKTDDPENQPLPDIRFLEMRYAMQKLFAGMQSKRALEAIFAGEPPDDDEPDPALNDALPSGWDEMFREAMRLGILNYRTELRWRKAILLELYQENGRYSREEEGDDEGLDEDEGDLDIVNEDDEVDEDVDEVAGPGNALAFQSVYL